MKRAIVLVDHGSRRPEANEQLAALSELVAERAPDAIVRCAHMELAKPDVAEAIADCVAGGAREIVVLPYFLGPGNHTTHDIPRLVRAAAEKHPDVVVKISEPLGLHPKLVDVILDRIDAATP